MSKFKSVLHDFHRKSIKKTNKFFNENLSTELWTKDKDGNKIHVISNNKIKKGNKK